MPPIPPAPTNGLRHVYPAAILLALIGTIGACAAWAGHTLVADHAFDSGWFYLGVVLPLAAGLFLNFWPLVALTSAVLLGAHLVAPDVAEAYVAGTAAAVLALLALGASAGVAAAGAAKRRPGTSIARHDGRVLGLSGHARAGKDTAATALIHSDPSWTRAAFADPIKNLALELNPWITVGPTVIRYADLIDREGYTEAKKRTEVREFLQRLGDGARRHIADDVWITAAMSNLPQGNVVFTDVRYPNEVAAVEAAGGTVVRINRPGNAPANDHPTEIALDNYPFEYVIYNSEGSFELGVQLRRVLADKEHRSKVA